MDKLLIDSSYSCCDEVSKAGEIDVGGNSDADLDDGPYAFKMALRAAADMGERDKGTALHAKNRYLTVPLC